MRDQDDGDFRDGMPFLGSRLWIDFVNSAPVAVGDFLATPEGLARWLDAARLSQSAASSALVPLARDLRAALAEIFESLREGRAPLSQSVNTVNRHLATVSTQRRLDIHDDHVCVEELSTQEPAPLAAIASDLADFVADYEPARLRHCANPECSMVFYDTARNATRRWCSMSACGNRHKVRSHRSRKPASS